MLVSAISNLTSGSGALPRISYGVKSSNYSHYNYFGAKKETLAEQGADRADLFHKIALWRDFCEKQIIAESSPKALDYSA